MNKYVSCVRKHMLITYVNMLNEHALSDWPASPLPRAPATGGEGGVGKWSLEDEAPVPDGLAAAGGGISFFAATNGAGGAGGSGGEACGAAGDRNKRARRKRAHVRTYVRVCLHAYSGPPSLRVLQRDALAVDGLCRRQRCHLLPLVGLPPVDDPGDDAQDPLLRYGGNKTQGDEAPPGETSGPARVART